MERYSAVRKTCHPDKTGAIGRHLQKLTGLTGERRTPANKFMQKRGSRYKENFRRGREAQVGPTLRQRVSAGVRRTDRFGKRGIAGPVEGGVPL